MRRTERSRRRAQRSVPYKIDYANSSNTGGGAIGATDQGFCRP